MIINTTYSHTDVPTQGVRLILPTAIIRQFQEKVQQRSDAGLPYVSAEDLMELWIVDMAAKQHPIPNPYGDQTA